MTVTQLELIATPRSAAAPRCPNKPCRRQPLEHLHGTVWRCPTCTRGFTHK